MRNYTSTPDDEEDNFVTKTFTLTCVEEHDPPRFHDVFVFEEDYRALDKDRMRKGLERLKTPKRRSRR